MVQYTVWRAFTRSSFDKVHEAVGGSERCAALSKGWEVNLLEK